MGNGANSYKVRVPVKKGTLTFTKQKGEFVRYDTLWIAKGLTRSAWTVLQSDGTWKTTRQVWNATGQGWQPEAR